ncbi:MAG: hypothetical protein KIT80_14430 [Chitinophagaceae bacterium]|nr:hypothetical protein [Chitinophagaceae bacterium]MCW5928110.1 hypothetical protein [Chitinophagaceae bacterium]
MSLFLAGSVNAQVNAVEFGKNRVQYEKMNWRYYQTRNFNVYFTQNGLALAKYTAQLAEKELPAMEDFVEYGSQRRINIVVYNSFNDLQQSNIGLGIDWQNTGGVTKFVNNKMIVYFDGNHANLRKQIRQGIAKTLLDNLLFGDNLGEFASNQALLDLPVWLTDGYIRYAAENWSAEMDDKLKSALLSGKYRTFYQFAFDQPELAGHSFWNFIANNYRRDNVTYFLYLARIYKSLNSASKKVTKQKFKDVLKEFMEKESDKYYQDLRGRRNAPRGSVVALEEVNKNLDYYRFQANPNPRNNTYAVVRFKRGTYRIELEDFGFKRKILLKSGVLDNQNEINPNYPQLAWDPKGSRLVVVYMEQNQLRMFVYDLVKRLKTSKQALPEEFQQVTDVKYMLDDNTLLFSAVKNGFSDIFVYKIKEQTLQQITNDVYDDLDPTFVAFPGKTGIIFSSNRPSGNAVSNDTILPSSYRFNIFLVDNWNRSDFRQITKLTDVKYGNARYPMQYNTSHFTFVNDEMGIANRYAGFFTTRRAGVDTVYRVGDEFLRNPDPAELDSIMQAWNKSEPDSIAYMSVTTDSAYSFPITNYQSSLQETRIAGDKGQVTEVRQEGELKMLYKLRVNEDALKRRNISVRPTEYMKKVIDQDRISKGAATIYQPMVVDTVQRERDIFQSEFEDDNANAGRVVQAESPLRNQTTILGQAKLFDYRLKFSTQYSVSGFNNTVLMTRWQPYGGGSGPIYMTNGNSNLNGMIRLGVSDLFEDIKFIGGFRLGLNLDDADVMFSYQNLRRRFDWGLTYYRSTVSNYRPITAETGLNRLVSNLYQFNIAYPFDRVKSVRATVAYRLDRTVYKTDVNYTLDPIGALKRPDDSLHAVLTHLEYVHDNSLNPALNIWNGLRYKVFTDINTDMTRGKQGKVTFNVGADARYYYPIYRNFIWAARAAFDISWGSQKMMYYLGGTDGWINPKFNDALKPQSGTVYAYQTLAVNMRGYRQNAAHGNNAVVLNSEFRLPVFTTLLSRPINNAFVRNFQLIQFVDFGTAWDGEYNQLKRPPLSYSYPPNSTTPTVVVNLKGSGLGPFVGGYGFGARSTLLGYFLKVDAGWPMSGFFSGKPIWYFSLGLDF